mgnify:CR=1 FL=1
MDLPKIPSMRNRGVIGMVQTLMVLGVLLGVGIYVMYQVFTAIPTLPANSASANASTNVQLNFWNGMTLAGIALIVVAAAGILSVVMSGFGRAQ